MEHLFQYQLAQNGTNINNNLYTLIKQSRQIKHEQNNFIDYHQININQTLKEIDKTIEKTKQIVNSIKYPNDFENSHTNRISKYFYTKKDNRQKHQIYFCNNQEENVNNSALNTNYIDNNNHSYQNVTNNNNSNIYNNHHIMNHNNNELFLYCRNNNVNSNDREYTNNRNKTPKSSQISLFKNRKKISPLSCKQSQSLSYLISNVQDNNIDCIKQQQQILNNKNDKYSINKQQQLQIAKQLQISVFKIDNCNSMSKKQKYNARMKRIANQLNRTQQQINLTDQLMEKIGKKGKENHTQVGKVISNSYQNDKRTKLYFTHNNYSFRDNFGREDRAIVEQSNKKNKNQMNLTLQAKMKQNDRQKERQILMNRNKLEDMVEKKKKKKKNYSPVKLLELYNEKIVHFKEQNQRNERTKKQNNSAGKSNNQRNILTNVYHPKYHSQQ